MNRFLAFALTVSIACFSGCSPSDQPELGQVTGKVTMNGEPLTGIDVVFQPDSGRPARGKTNDMGEYKLIYIRDTLGAKIGNNRVEIAPVEGGEEEDEVQADDVDSLPQTKRKLVKASKPRVPARYNLESELKREVKAGKNVFDFELESK